MTQEDLYDIVPSLETEKYLNMSIDSEAYTEELASVLAIDGSSISLFVNRIKKEMFFEADWLTGLFNNSTLNWRQRVKKEEEFMMKILPVLKANGIELEKVEGLDEYYSLGI